MSENAFPLANITDDGSIPQLGHMSQHEKANISFVGGAGMLGVCVDYY